MRINCTIEPPCLGWRIRAWRYSTQQRKGRSWRKVSYNRGKTGLWELKPESLRLAWWASHAPSRQFIVWLFFLKENNLSHQTSWTGYCLCSAFLYNLVCSSFFLLSQERRPFHPFYPFRNLVSPNTSPSSWNCYLLLSKWVRKQSLTISCFLEENL